MTIETKTIGVRGNQFPAYLKGRPRATYADRYGRPGIPAHLR